MRERKVKKIVIHNENNGEGLESVPSMECVRAALIRKIVEQGELLEEYEDLLGALGRGDEM